MAARNGIANSDERKVDVLASDFNQRFSSKGEVWKLLATEVGAYLDDYKVMSVYHLRDVVSGNRTILKSKDIKHISVPFYESLSVARML